MAYKKSKKTKHRVDKVVAHIQSSFNNTLVTITTPEGDVLMRDSSGALGFKGSRKGTPFAATQIGASLAKKMHSYGGIKELEINASGPGAGRDSVMRGLMAGGFRISVIRDVTKVPHNGCRQPKKRRV